MNYYAYKKLCCKETYSIYEYALTYFNLISIKKKIETKKRHY